jgi:serine/threonine protein kinase HipA of HipAB toxin-antitoxin module
LRPGIKEYRRIGKRKRTTGDNMNGKDDMAIAKKMGVSVLDLHEILSRFEKLDARELNLVAMQLINRAVMKLES